MRLFADEFRTVVEARPAEPLYTFVDESGAEVATWSAREAWDRAVVLAGALRRECRLVPGDRVLLVFPPGLEFIEAMLGCMLAGVVPVPVPLPARYGGGLEALAAIAKDSAASACLTNEALHGVQLPCFVIETLRSAESLPIAPSSADALALLQYTSGSTRSPRGVAVTYANLQHQLADQRQKLQCEPDGRMVFWLPHYHDFALICAVMGGAHGNGRIVLSSPVAFLRRPGLWGELMTRYRATQTAAPDFGYKLLVERTTKEERARWDLSSLKGMVCAAEPIRAATVDALLAALERCGLKRSAFAPCYGLAEHTVAATMFGTLRRKFSRRALEEDNRAVIAADAAVELFGCGRPSEGVLLRIVNPSTCAPLADGSVGEIWLDSPSKALGYFGREEESRAVFAAQIAGEAGRWLRTGDLGVLVDGELFVTGRLKDLVILKGRNVYPQDVEEATCEAHAAIRPGHVACFGIERDGEEHLVVVAELRDEAASARDLRDIGRAVRGALQKRLQLLGLVLVFAKRDQVARTTSGKIRRAACRQAWSEGRLALHAERVQEEA